MINLKNNKGAITLYILICVLFFVIAIVNVHSNLKSKEARVESEYQKIKASYEKDAGEKYNTFIDKSVYIQKKTLMNLGDSPLIGVIFMGIYNNNMVYIYETNDSLTKNDLVTLKSENQINSIAEINHTMPYKYLPSNIRYIYLWVEDDSGVISNFIRFEPKALLEAEIESKNYGTIIN